MISTNNTINTAVSSSNTSNTAVSTSNTSNTDVTVDKATQTNNEQQQNTVQSNSQTTLSSKGERLAALNQEFNILSPSFAITDDFLSRLTDLGFISQDQSAKLRQDIGVNNTSTSADTLATTKQNTNNIIDRLKNDEQAESLVTTLNKATSIIDNFAKTSSSDILSTIAQLEYHLKSNDAVTLSDNEKVVLSNLKTVLSIAEKLNPQSRTSSNIDKYLQ